MINEDRPFDLIISVIFFSLAAVDAGMYIKRSVEPLFIYISSPELNIRVFM